MHHFNDFDGRRAVAVSLRHWRDDDEDEEEVGGDGVPPGRGMTTSYLPRPMNDNYQQ